MANGCTIYRGKHPKRIESVWVTQGFVSWTNVRTNDGGVYIAQSRELNGKRPNLGDELPECFTFDYQSAFRRSPAKRVTA